VDVEALVEQQLGKMAPASGQAQVVRQIASISKMRLEKKKFPKNFEGVLRFNNTVRALHLLPWLLLPSNLWVVGGPERWVVGGPERCGSLAEDLNHSCLTPHERYLHIQSPSFG